MDGNPPKVAVPSEEQYKAFNKRWLILSLFACLSASNAFQWIEYSVINDQIAAFYHVSAAAVNWTSMVYMLCYIPLILPATWLLDRHGLRLVVACGAAGNALGAALKCFSAAADRFAITMVGQTVAGASQIFILGPCCNGVPPRLAAVWFGGGEVSTACALGVFGNQLGIAAGFLLPPIVVTAGANVTNGSVSMDEELIASQLFWLFFWSAAVNVVIFVLIIALFADRPPVPPSLAQLSALEAGVETNYMRSLRRLLTDRNYVLLLLTYGINVGVFYAVSTLLNQTVLATHPGENVNVGRIGLLIVLAGVAGSALSGMWLDYSHTFKGTTVFIYVFSLLGMIGYTITVQTGPLALVFITAGFLGFFMTGYLPIGFEFGAELTYPTAEGTQSGLLNASAQVFGIWLTQFMGDLLTWTSPLVANVCQCGALAVGALLTCLISADLKRRRANLAEPTVAGEMVSNRSDVMLLQASATTDSFVPLRPDVGHNGPTTAPVQRMSENSL